MRKPYLPKKLRAWLAAQSRAIKRLEKDDLDLQRAGQWPDLIKGLVLFGLLVAVPFASNWLLIGSLRDQVDAARSEQAELYERYRVRAFQAANLEAYQQQMKMMEATFNELLGKLPAAREVPRLLEDIQEQANLHRLDLRALSLRDDQRRDFYSELPFEIRAQGSFHQLASFMAGISSLDRIITLHDFTLSPIETGQPTQVNLVLQARTYKHDGRPSSVEAR